MTALAVTADDFGLCAEIDRAICVLHDRGIVRRASLVVNTASFDESVALLRSRPALEVAVHLNLTDGRPVLPAAAVPTLVDDRGEFRGGRHYGIAARILAGRASRGDIQREWRAQVAKARDAGLTIEELNAHGHLHLLPPLHEIVLALRREFGVPRIRLVHSTEGPRGWLLTTLSRGLQRRLAREGAPPFWPDRTLGLRSPGDIDPGIHLRDLQSHDGTTIELIVHPSQGANHYHTRWGYAGTEVLNWLLREAPSRQ